MNTAQQLFIINRQLQGLRLSSDTFYSIESQAKNRDAITRVKANTSQESEWMFHQPLSQQALVNTMIFPQRNSSKLALEQINASSILFARYKGLLDMNAHYISDSQAAASTPTSDEATSSSHSKIQRITDNFNIVCKPDPENTDQAFVVLEITNSVGIDNAASIFLHAQLAEAFYVLHFENGHKQANNNLKFQKLLSVTSHEYTALSKPNCRLYLSPAST